MADYKQLCAELLLFSEEAGEICTSEGLWPVKCDPNFTLLNRARAALAESAQEGPTDEELLSLDQLRDTWNAQADAANSWDELGVDEIIWWAQRQALARWGRPAPEPPADGEVAELVAWLRRVAAEVEAEDYTTIYSFLLPTRAADLLERLASPACLVVNPPPEAVQALKAAGPGRIELMPADPPQPVPLSERLPGPEDCDGEGRCWAWNPDPPDNDEEESWVLQPRAWIHSPWTTHWLPAHALPVPADG